MDEGCFVDFRCFENEISAPSVDVGTGRALIIDCFFFDLMVKCESKRFAYIRYKKKIKVRDIWDSGRCKYSI